MERWRLVRTKPSRLLALPLPLGFVADRGGNSIRPCAFRQRPAFPAEPDLPLIDQLVDPGMDDRHRDTPVRGSISGGPRHQLSCDLAGAYRRSRRPFGEEREYCGPRPVDVHFGFRPDVMRSGFGGGFHPGGGMGRCRLVPSPMAPGCWRTRPDVSACSASAALAPPRIRWIRSRRRRASSKSSARAAASILRCRSSIVSAIMVQRATAALGRIGRESLHHAFRRNDRCRGKPPIRISETCLFPSRSMPAFRCQRFRHAAGAHVIANAGAFACRALSMAENQMFLEF